MKAARLFGPMAALAVLAACSPDTPENEVAAGSALEVAEAGAASAESEGPALNGEDLPSDFARTAWRVEDEDGARYTTYLDEGGVYRDLRNGDPWHSGSWEVDEDGRLCLTPETDDTASTDAGEEDTAPRTCWTPRGMDGDGGMIVQASSGKRVRLQQVDYRAPDSEDAEDEADTETSEAA